MDIAVGAGISIHPGIFEPLKGHLILSVVRKGWLGSFRIGQSPD